MWIGKEGFKAYWDSLSQWNKENYFMPNALEKKIEKTKQTINSTNESPTANGFGGGRVKNSKKK